MNIVAIVQARMGSTRLPNKVMKEINGVPLIELLLMRLSKSRLINKIVLATSNNDQNEKLIKHVKSIGFDVSLGSELDVLDRYITAANEHKADVVVRITGDCPLVDPNLVDSCISSYLENNADYLSNTILPTYPDGLDVEVVSIEALRNSAELASDNYDREHVTPYLKKADNLKRINKQNEIDLSGHRWTVDDPEDFTVIKSIFENFWPNIFFSWHDVYKFEKDNPHIFEINKNTQRNAGAIMNTGQKLWKRAKKVIPGGNMLLSKRPEMFLPELWPTYFSAAKGCFVWDLDGNRYIDVSIMGIGTNTLGYGYPDVDSAVRKVIDMGNMSTLNCPEEVLLAEMMIELHPWADMARFARSGGEANAISIRIARAATGKDNVAFCGYHGWHDWYLSANLGDEQNLAGHLLPGLDPCGVPKNLRSTVFPFQYNNYAQLEYLVENHNIGIIKMEVVRNHEPKDDFLRKVRDLATRKGIVLIFDECTSGFRETFGGLHKKYGVEPDMAMFGKALGNGYAITAIIGKRAVMEAAQSTFISSTFWTERIGPAAAIATIHAMEKIRSWEIITSTGQKIRKNWQVLADKYGLKIDHWGLAALAGFNFVGKNNLAYKTIISQEMLKKGFLASNCVYACIDHTDDVLDKYFYELESVFSLISECESGRPVEEVLSREICHGGFKRLN